jgi:hypothetical protein
MSISDLNTWIKQWYFLHHIYSGYYIVIIRLSGSPVSDSSVQYAKMKVENMKPVLFFQNLKCRAFLIFRKWEGIVGTGWSGLRIGTGGGHL